MSSCLFCDSKDNLLKARIKKKEFDICKDCLKDLRKKPIVYCETCDSKTTETIYYKKIAHICNRCIKHLESLNLNDKELIEKINYYRNHHIEPKEENPKKCEMCGKKNVSTYNYKNLAFLCHTCDSFIRRKNLTQEKEEIIINYHKKYPRIIGGKYNYERIFLEKETKQIPVKKRTAPPVKKTLPPIKKEIIPSIEKAKINEIQKWRCCKCKAVITSIMIRNKLERKNEYNGEIYCDACYEKIKKDSLK